MRRRSRLKLRGLHSVVTFSLHLRCRNMFGLWRDSCSLYLDSLFLGRRLRGRGWVIRRGTGQSGGREGGTPILDSQFGLYVNTYTQSKKNTSAPACLKRRYGIQQFESRKYVYTFLQEYPLQ